MEQYIPVEESLFARMAKSSKEFIVVLGAGASRPAGLPGWDGLRDGLLKKFKEICMMTGGLDDEKQKEIKEIENNTDLWDAFGDLRRIMHKADFNGKIKELLSTGNKSVPELYELIWALDIAGIVTYNLDDFADRSNSHTFASHWKEAQKYANYLHNSEPFVFHPHGMLNDPSSWVLTRGDTKALYNEPNFTKFMTALINTKHILIVGFDPSDQIFLDMLHDLSIAEGEKTVFYLCPSEDGTVSKSKYNKYTDYGIGVIPYNSSNNHKFLIDFFRQLRTEQRRLQSEEPLYPVIRYHAENLTDDGIPAPEAMGAYSYNEMRIIMSNALSHTISQKDDGTPSKEDMEKLQEFYNKYSEQLYEAWHLNPRNANREANKVFGYTLKERIGKGSFGGVYDAEDAEGGRCAIKILLQEVTGEENYLNCFRRGVHTMRMLSDNNLEGVVKFREAFEVPACIVMDFIAGDTLREAIDGRKFSHSARADKIKLEILMSIAKTINAAHKLEKHVLHRDLKPENIILEDFYYLDDDNEPIPVKIVDFDLSWHRGAQGLTVAKTGSAGYVAPEQLPGQTRDKTKNALVDVYSIGMLLYYMMAERDPYPNQHAFKNFREDIDQVLKDNCKFQWQTTRKYLTELIMDATRQEQEERISLSAFIGQLETIIQMESGKNVLPSSHELLAYEITSRIDSSMAIESVKSGANGDIFAKQDLLGKTFKFERTYKDKKFLLSIQIIKRHTGLNSMRNVELQTKKSIAKAQGKVNRTIFQNVEFDWEVRAIIANLTAVLPDEISVDFVKKLSANLMSISAEMQFNN